MIEDADKYIRLSNQFHYVNSFGFKLSIEEPFPWIYFYWHLDVFVNLGYVSAHFSCEWHLCLFHTKKESCNFQLCMAGAAAHCKGDTKVLWSWEFHPTPVYSDLNSSILMYQIRLHSYLGINLVEHSGLHLTKNWELSENTILFWKPTGQGVKAG